MSEYVELVEANEWWKWVNQTTRLYTDLVCIACAGPGPERRPLLVFPSPHNHSSCARWLRESSVALKYEASLKANRCTPATCGDACKYTYRRSRCTRNCNVTMYQYPAKCGKIRSRHPVCPVDCLAVMANSHFNSTAITKACTNSLRWSYMPSDTKPPPHVFPPKSTSGFECIQVDDSRPGSVHMGTFSPCARVIKTSGNNHFPDWSFKLPLFVYRIQDLALADMWWVCGNRTLLPVLPKFWTGTCTRVMLVHQFTIFPYTAHSSTSRTRRSLSEISNIGTDPANIWFDAIGVPRGVPDEFKARNQVAAGFESSVCWWCTTNKNVDWINYLYYNMMYFGNLTRAALLKIQEELHPNTLMTKQNRIAIDMLLAERGGVCSMFGEDCCTFIPDNSGPSGELNEIIQKMHDLSVKMHEGAGVDTSAFNWFSDMFTDWKTTLMKGAIMLLVFIVVMSLIFCCCIPCLRSVLSQLLTKMLNKQMLQITGYHKLPVDEGNDVVVQPCFELTVRRRDVFSDTYAPTEIEIEALRLLGNALDITTDPPSADYLWVRRQPEIIQYYLGFGPEESGQYIALDKSQHPDEHVYDAVSMLFNEE